MLTSLSTGVVPSSLKTAIITPILKKRGLCPDELKNFRPVSNLALIGKVIERTVVKQLMDHMTAAGLHDELQSAYKPGHSVETALLKLKSDIDTALDSGSGMILVLLDLSTTFDTIDHL